MGGSGGNRTKHVKAIFLYTACGLWVSRDLFIEVRRNMERVRRAGGGGLEEENFTLKSPLRGILLAETCDIPHSAHISLSPSSLLSK